MNNQINEIANRIREIREVCGYTQKQLALELGVSYEIYKQYEEKGDDIPISILYEIANKFGIDFNELVTGDVARLDTYHVVKRGYGKSVDRYTGYNFEDLAYRFGHKIMQPLLVTLDPSDEAPELVTHAGQEFNMVLEGELELYFEDKIIKLSPGDSVYFDPTHLHGQKCLGDVKARFLTVISE